MTQPALLASGVSSGYGQSTVVRNLDLRVAAGEIVALLGKNGMGKSTLLKTFMGFLARTSGSFALFGRTIEQYPPHHVARLGVGYVPQEKALFQDLSVEQNLRLALPRGADWRVARARVEAAFPFLCERLAQRAGTLSGGEQKMLLISRALASGAKLILVDEITEGLQPSVIDRLAGVIRAERSQYGTSFLLVEQNVPFSLGVADRFAVLDRGEIVDGGDCADGHAAARIAPHLVV